MHIHVQILLDDIRAVFSRARLTIASVEHVLQCALLYAGATAMDYLTSMHFPPGVQESNPFARHVDGTFWLKHALVTDSVFSGMNIFLSLGCYIGARVFGKKAALFAAGLPWLYAAYLHCSAAFDNLLIEIPGLFVQTEQDILRHLLG